MPIALLGAAIMLYDTFREVRHGNLSIDLLASIAVISAVLIHEFLPAAIIVVMLLGGQAIEEYASGRSSRAIDGLIKMRPVTANVLKADGQIVTVPIEELRVDDIVVVKPGDRIPVDGLVISGSASVDQSSITGESVPVEKSIDETVLSGTICQNGVLQIRASKVGEDTKFAHIIKLVRQAQGSKARIQRVADQYAKWFTPIILLFAAITYAITAQPVRSVTILLAASPCPLLLATPVAVVSAIGRAAKLGILVRSGSSLELAGSVGAVVFDKTGTLTYGQLRVVRIQSFGDLTSVDVVMYTAVAEKFSTHPIGKAVVKYTVEHGIKVGDPENFREISGEGVMTEFEGMKILFGNARFIESQLIQIPSEVRSFLEDSDSRAETTLLLSRNGEVSGAIGLADVLKPTAKIAVEKLRADGIDNIIILTGDSRKVGEAVAKELGVNVFSEVLPDEKALYIQKMKNNQSRVAMVGDGINDAPALATADVGIAMGAAGSDVAIETADFTIMADDVVKVPEAIRLSRGMMRIAKQSLTVGLLANGLGVALSAFGILNPVMGATFHECADLFVILNSARAFTTKVT
ncbi:MAG: heavy metal translocating P-type ATPase [Candidatus Bathyarchaeia archaeon]